MATREAVSTRFDEFVSIVTASLAELETAKVEAARADAANEENAVAPLVAKIDAAMARIRAATPSLPVDE